MQIKMNLEVSNVIKNLNGSYLKKCEIFGRRENIDDENDRNMLRVEDMLDDKCVEEAYDVNGDNSGNDKRIFKEKSTKVLLKNDKSENEDSKCAVNTKIDNLKISFGVDRLLNNNTIKCDSKTLINQRQEIQQQTSSIKRFASEVLTVDKLLSSPVSSPGQIDQKCKAIIRPMPMRYLAATVPHISSSYAPNLVPTPDNATTNPIRMSTIYKFSNISFNHSHFIKEKSLEYQDGHHHFYAKSQINQHTYPINERSSITMLSNNPNGSHSATTSSSSSHSTPASSSTHSKRKRSWSRAVFSQLQRKGLEIQFQIQKYITKPDRRKLAARLGLTDAQVKVWFQNRRMKWRHTRENKLNQNKSNGKGSTSTTDECNNNSKENDTNDYDELDIGDSSSSSSGDNEIDVEAE